MWPEMETTIQKVCATHIEMFFKSCVSKVYCLEPYFLSWQAAIESPGALTKKSESLAPSQI